MMLFGVFSLVNIEKGRVAGSGAPKYTAAYEVTTRTGSKYLQYFYKKNEHKIPKFLLNVTKRGGVAARIDTAHKHPAVEVTPPPEQKPASAPTLWVAAADAALQDKAPATPKKVAVTTAQVGERTMQHANDVRYQYVRLGDKLRSIDPEGHKLSRDLQAADEKLAEMKERSAASAEEIAKLVARGATTGVGQANEERARLEGDIKELQAHRTAMSEALLKRPLGLKMLRVGAVEAEMKRLRAEGRKWIEENPEQWKAYLRSHRAKAGHVTRRGQESYEPLEFPHHIEEQLNKLKWKLKGLKGDTHAIPKKAPKLGVGEHLVIATSPEVSGLSAEEAPVSYALSAGTWGTKAANGHNSFTAGTAAALYQEYADVIGGIVRGRGFKPGWSKVFDVKDFNRELTSHLRVRLFELAAMYTPALAEAQVAQGRNFRSFAIGRLEGDARNFVRERLAESVKHGDAPPEVLDEAALDWDDEGVMTNRQLRDMAGSAVATGYASADDMLAIKDVQRIIQTKVGHLEGLGLLSRLNLLRPSDDPKDLDKNGLKTWDAVARDVVAELHKEGAESIPSLAYAKEHLMEHLPRMFTGQASGLRGSQSPMTPSEKVGLREGLSALLRVVGAHRNQSMPGTSSWRVAQAPVKPGYGKHARPGVSTPLRPNADLHRVVTRGPVHAEMTAPVSGHMTPKPLLGVKPEVHTFWTSQARATTKNPTRQGMAPHFDPARELDLAMDLYGPTASLYRPDSSGKHKLPTHVLLKQMRAKQYMKVWKKMQKMGTWRLVALHTTPAFKEFSQKWEEAQAKVALALQAAHDAGAVPRIPLDVALTVQMKNKALTLEGISPRDVLKMASLIRRQRELDNNSVPLVVSKSLKRKLPPLHSLFAKMHRLLRGS